jgi:hypothetical protein
MPRGRPPKTEEPTQATLHVRCVSPNKPFADGKPLEFWGVYEVPAEHARILEQNRQAVILTHDIAEE